jgi:outer membrane protein OmpA-like peptidoglycan-associated protein
MLARVRWPAGAFFVVLVTAQLAAAADGAFTLEAPLAAQLRESEPGRPGVLPAAAIYLAAGRRVQGGLRLRSGILPARTGGDSQIVRTVGFVSFAIATRVRPWLLEGSDRRTDGPWLELAGGAHLTGGRALPTAEAGLGWGFRAGGATLGPSLRYVAVLQPAGSAHVHLGLLGLEVGFSTGATPPAAPLSVPVGTLVVERYLVAGDRDDDGVPDVEDRCPDDPEDRDGFQDQDGCPDPDNDRDGIADAADKCPNQAEVVNGVDDQDGCPDKGVIEMVDNRIVLDSQVLFDQDRARVRTAARPHLIAILVLWKQHPEWQRIIIEGHSDGRGRDAYNDWLSTERAGRVRRALIGMGVTADRLEIKGMGRSHPRDTSGTPEAHRRNRRVEFVIIRAPSPATASAAP